MSSFDWTMVAVLAGIYLACGLGLIVILALEARKPPTDTDRRLSRVDEELSERERAARWMGGGFRG